MAKPDERDVLLDHNYDGIQELDNKLPPWWLWMFYISIVFSVIYMLHYHVIGTGDSSYAEYMKEFDPEWKPSATQSGFSIGYSSPFYGGKDLTPHKRIEIALLAAAEAKAAAVGGSVAISDLKFEDLIMAAMEVSTAEELEKLKVSFPDIGQLYDSRSTGGQAEPAAPAEPLIEIDPLTDEASLASGKSIFIANCVTCHGQNGEGGIGPNMTDDYFLHGVGMTNMVSVIKSGIPAKGMISWRGILKEQQILEVASYILTLQGTSPANAKAPQGERAIAGE